MSPLSGCGWWKVSSMRTSRRPRRPFARLLGSVAALTLSLGASFTGPLAIGAEPPPGLLPSLPPPSIIPSLPLPSLPLPSLPIPSVPLPSASVPIPSASVPIPSLPVPSVSVPPSLPLPSLTSPPSGSPSTSSGPPQSSGTSSGEPTETSGDPSPLKSGSASEGGDDQSPVANGVFTAASPSARDQPSSGEVGAGPFGPIGLPELVGAGSAAFLFTLLGLYLAASAGWLAVVRRKLGGIGLRVTTWREERLRGRHPGH